MSTIKNFGLAGIGSDIQFGKSGPRLIQTGGTSFAFKNNSAASLVVLEVGAPTGDTHAATRLFVNTGLSDTRTGAGLNTTTGAYTPQGSSNYLTAATSLVNADHLLDAQIKIVKDELDVTQTGAGLNATGTYTANDTANYVNGATSLKDADNKLDFALSQLQGEVNTVETAAGLGTDGTLPAWSATNYVTGTASLYNAIKALDTQLKTTTDNVTGLGSAFNYVGTLDGGASSGTAYDLDTLAAGGKNPGDYYKVSTAGYFEMGGVTNYFNLGDGIVFNTSGSYDKIDNTDSSVAGTTNRISVTGATDTGYTVDISSAYVGQTSITTLGTITTGTWSAGTIAVDKGGTGLTSYSSGDLLYASGATTLSKLAKGTSLQVLRMNLGATAPEYVTLDAPLIPFSDAGFAATNVSAALIELDSQINSMTGNSIQSADTKTAVATDNTLGIRFYDEISTTKTEFLRVTGSGSAATLTAQGSGNVDIVLDPLGTGSVDVSSAKITSLANATAATDALPFGQSKAIHTSYKVMDITETVSNTTIGSVNGVVLRVMVLVTAAFAPGTTFTIGYSGQQSALATATEIEHTAVGVYVIDNIVSLDQTIVAYTSANGTGTAKVIIEYLAA